MKRRDFIKTSAVTGASIASAGLQGCKTGHYGGASSSGKLPRREFGNTGEMLSVIGFGGIVIKDHEQEKANRVVAEAVEREVNYFDVAPRYGDAEIILGPALEPYRKGVFLACKTKERSRESAEMEFNRSLERLRTDYFDLYQLHSIFDVKEDVDAVFVKGGVMEMLIEKKKQGQIRYLGFSAHSVPAAMAAMDRYDFDSILFPLNYSAYHKGDFGPQIMAKSQEKGVARLTLKAMALGRWAKNDPKRKEPGNRFYTVFPEPDGISMALRWTLSQPITATLPPGVEKYFRLALDIACESTSITEQEEGRLKEMSEPVKPLFPVT